MLSNEQNITEVTEVPDTKQQLDHNMSSACTFGHPRKGNYCTGEGAKDI